MSSRFGRRLIPLVAVCAFSTALGGCVAYAPYGYGYPAPYHPGGYYTGAYVGVGGGWHDGGWHR